MKNYWTSGTNEGLNCDLQNVYGWCSGKELMSLAPFAGFMRAAADARTERCLLFKPDPKENASLISHEKCANDVKLPFICEPSCKAASCPASCTKSVKFHFSKVYSFNFNTRTCLELASKRRRWKSFE